MQDNIAAAFDIEQVQGYICFNKRSVESCRPIIANNMRTV